MDLFELSQATESSFPQPKALAQTLWAHQVAALEYAVKTRRVLVGDDVGVGKTAVALAAIEAIKAYPALIVCPAFLRYKWERDIEAWLPGKKVQVVEPGEPLIPEGMPTDPDFFIVSYNLLPAYLKELKMWPLKAFVGDESHYVKNRKAGRTKACIKASKDCVLRLLLGATSIERAPKDLVSQLEVIGTLEEFGGSWRFLQHFCNTFGDNIESGSKWARWDFDGARNLKELNHKLRSTCFIRRERMQVHKSLPPLTTARLDLAISNRTEYKAAEYDFLGWLTATAPDRVAGAAKAEAINRITHLKRLAALGKRHAVGEWIDGFLDGNPGEKLVVFTVLRDSAAYFADRHNAPMIVGGVSPERRDEQIQSFQVDSVERIIVVSVDAGGVGVDLFAASNCLFFEFDWVPSTQTQAIGRIHRPGQLKRTTAWYAIGRETIDEEIFKLLAARQKVIDGINYGEEVEVQKMPTIAPLPDSGDFYREFLKDLATRAS